MTETLQWPAVYPVPQAIFVARFPAGVLGFGLLLGFSVAVIISAIGNLERWFA